MTSPQRALIEGIEEVLLGVPPCAGIQVSVDRLLELGPRDQVRLRTRELCASHPSPKVRYHAQRVLHALTQEQPTRPLGDMKDPEVVAQALVHEDPEQRLLAISALGGIPRPRAQALVMEALGRPEEDPWVRSALTTALGYLGGEGAAEEAASLLEDPCPRVAANALLSLYRLEPTTALYASRWRLESPDNRLRANAVLVVSRTSPDMAWAHVRSMASSRDEWDRASACYLAAELAGPEAEGLMLQILLQERNLEIIARVLVWIAAQGSAESAGALGYWMVEGPRELAALARKGLESLAGRGGPQGVALEAAARAFAAERAATLDTLDQEPVPEVEPEEREPPPGSVEDLLGGLVASAQGDDSGLPSVEDPVEDALERLSFGDVEGAVKRLEPLAPEDGEGVPSRLLWALSRAYFEAGDTGLGLWRAQQVDPEDLEVEEVYLLACALEEAGALDSAEAAFGYLQARSLGYRDVEERCQRLESAWSRVPEDLLLLFAEDYRNVRPLGQGGMGMVFKAEERSTGRLVALKVPDEKLLEDERLRTRFLEEMQAMAGVSHPNVVPLLRVHLGERPYYTMEIVGGESLHRRIELRGKLPPEEALPLLEGVAAALSFLHGLGIIHQDLKPENVLVDHDGTARLLDFGMAVEVGRDFREQDHFRGGSPPYMAPEQLAASPPGPGTDVYAFGVMLYQALTGELPFPEENPVMKLYKEAPDLRERAPELPQEYAEVVRVCLRRSPAERPRDGSVVLRLVKGLRKLAPPLAPARPPPG